MRRRSSLFKRHKKTPSSPARLVTPLLQTRGGAADSLLLSSEETTPAESELFRRKAACRLSQDLDQEILTPVTTRRPEHRRRCSEGAGHLRRGKPNTVKTGLSIAYKRRSMENHLLPADTDKDRAASAVQSTLDTSPILKDNTSSATATSVPSAATTATSQLEVTDMDADVMCADYTMSRQVSTTSVSSLALADQTNLLSDHDRAFISESFMESPVIESSAAHAPSTASLLYTSTTNNTPEATGGKQLFVDSLSAGGGGGESASQRLLLGLNQSAYSDASSEASACTVIHNGQPQLKSKPMSQRLEAMAAEGKTSIAHTAVDHRTSSTSVTSQRCQSVDSAIDICDDAREGRLKKYGGSTHSMNSIDSGLSLGEQYKHVSGSSLKQSSPSADDATAARSPIDSGESFALERPQTPVLISVSKNTRQMLYRAGVVPTSASNTEQWSHDQAEHASSSQQEHDNAPAGPVSATNDDDVEAVKEIAERRISPYRFHKSHMRRRRSPVQIPPIFAKADREARMHVRTALGVSPNVARPSLPISSDNVSKMQARARLDMADESPEFNDPSAGNTPLRLPHKLKYNTVDIQADRDPAVENIENQPLATPRIKPGLLPSGKMQLKRMQQHYDVTDTRSSCRTPVKPTKRLQGASPSGNLYRSPKKQCGPKAKR